MVFSTAGWYEPLVKIIGSFQCAVFLTRQQLIYLGKVDRDVLNLNAVPIGVYLYNRSSQLQVSLLIVTIVNHRDDLPLVQVQ